MKRRDFLFGVLAAGAGGIALAADEKLDPSVLKPGGSKKADGSTPPARDPVELAFQLPKNFKPNKDQQTALKKLRTEYESKLRSLYDKVRSETDESEKTKLAKEIKTLREEIEKKIQTIITTVGVGPVGDNKNNGNNKPNNQHKAAPRHPPKRR